MLARLRNRTLSIVESRKLAKIAPVPGKILPLVYGNVKMKLSDEKEATEVKYLVVGINPLLIFREQDYNKASGTGG